MDLISYCLLKIFRDVIFNFEKLFDDCLSPGVCVDKLCDVVLVAFVYKADIILLLMHYVW
jgi:hypothetical protein